MPKPMMSRMLPLIMYTSASPYTRPSIVANGRCLMTIPALPAPVLGPPAGESRGIMTRGALQEPLAPVAEVEYITRSPCQTAHPPESV